MLDIHGILSISPETAHAFQELAVELLTQRTVAKNFLGNSSPKSTSENVVKCFIKHTTKMAFQIFTVLVFIYIYILRLTFMICPESNSDKTKWQLLQVIFVPD